LKGRAKALKISTVSGFEGFGEIAGFNLTEIALVVLLLFAIYLIYSKA